MKYHLLKRTDPAQELLLPFIKETEELMQELLQSIDSNSWCRVLPAVDLGFPHDVVRLAGGFCTGCYVEWKCSTPFIPIDTTVNIDTSSIFELEDDIVNDINSDTFENLKAKIESSSYIFNFHKGNHFISFGKRLSSDRPVLVIHSNEKEFKYQYNGLMPSDNNWFMEHVRVVRRKERYLRYLTDDAAELFIDIAKSLENYNVIRHRFIASLMTFGKTRILKQTDHHHYYMPTRESVAMGCFVVQPGEIVPIFSRPGKDIVLFEPILGGQNLIGDSGLMRNAVLVPHGWGKTCDAGINFTIDYDKNVLNLAGKEYEIKAMVSLGKDNRLQLRDFSLENNDEDSLQNQMDQCCPGTIVDKIKQILSYSQHGFLRHL